MVHIIPTWQNADCYNRWQSLRFTTVGVPQGSILGPLLFTLYVNELAKVAENCLTSMYADDTKLEHATKPQDIQLMETTINNDLDKLQSYFESNKLNINVPKCTFVFVGTQQSLAKCNEINIKIGDENIPQVQTSRYAGGKYTKMECTY